jgi:hypothetical protein
MISSSKYSAGVASERYAADSYPRMAKSDNTRRAYRAAVRAWCAWCARQGLPPLPAAGQDVAAFLAGEHGRKLSPETIKLRRAAIRYLHRTAGCPVPTDDVCVSETLAGIRREAAKKGPAPPQEGACAGCWRRSLTIYVACGTGRCAGRLRRGVAALGTGGDSLRAVDDDRAGYRPHLRQTKGEQTDAVTVSLPYGDTELCRVRALELRQQAAGLTEGPVFRRIWLPPAQKAAAPAGSTPLPRIGSDAITP